MSKNVQQGVFYEKFVRYIELDRGMPFSDDERSEILERFSKGLCHGFSVTHSYMAATDKLEWWKKLLEIMSEWEKWDEKSLEERVILPKSYSDNENGETLKSLFGRVINYVLYNHGSEIGELAQRDILKKNGFTSEKGDIVRMLQFLD